MREEENVACLLDIAPYAKWNISLPKLDNSRDYVRNCELEGDAALTSWYAAENAAEQIHEFDVFPGMYSSLFWTLLESKSDP